MVTRFLAHFDVMLIDLAEEKEEAELEQEERKKLDVSWHCPKVDPALVSEMRLEDFHWLRKLGQGSYGDVWLVKVFPPLLRLSRVYLCFSSPCSTRRRSCSLR